MTDSKVNSQLTLSSFLSPSKLHTHTHTVYGYTNTHIYV